MESSTSDQSKILFYSKFLNYSFLIHACYFDKLSHLFTNLVQRPNGENLKGSLCLFHTENSWVQVLMDLDSAPELYEVAIANDKVYLC